MRLYDATVPGFRQTIGAVAGLLAKAEAFCRDRGIDPAEIVGARLAPDMLPFSWQVKWTASHSAGAIDYVRAGGGEPDRAAPPDDFAALGARLAAADAALAAVDPAELETLARRDVLFAVNDLRLPFTGEDYLLSFALPNLHFHASMAYAILRAAGVPLVKRDYLGAMRLKA